MTLYISFQQIFTEHLLCARNYEKEIDLQCYNAFSRTFSPILGTDMDAIQERMSFVLMKALRQHIIEHMLKSNWKNGKASQMI